MNWTFVCAEHEEYGELGWKLANMPAFDQLPGMAVAHDVLEHWRNDDSTTGELLALGAMMHVRGEDYYGNKGKIQTAPSYHMHGEIAELLLKIHYGAWVELKDAPKQYRCAEVQDEIDATIHLIKKYLREERPGEDYKFSKRDERNVRAWLAQGYRKATRRYRNIRRHVLLDTFCEIEAAADKALKYAEEGTKFHVDLKWESGVISDARYPKLNMWTSEPWEEERR